MSDDWASDWGAVGGWSSGNDNWRQPAAPTPSPGPAPSASPAAAYPALTTPAWNTAEDSAPARRDYFDLEDGVGSGAANRRSDVAKVETALGHAGFHDLNGTDGPTGYYGAALGESIKDYQADRGLTVDGYLAPGGETIGGLRRDVGEALGGHLAPTAREIDAHHDALASGREGLLWTGIAARLRPRDDLPALSAELAGDATRTARAARGTSDHEGLARYLSDMMAGSRGGEGGAKAESVAYVRDVIGQVGAQDAKAGETLLGKTLGFLAPDEQVEVLGGPLPAVQPLGTFKPGALEAHQAAPDRARQGRLDAADLAAQGALADPPPVPPTPDRIAEARSSAAFVETISALKYYDAAAAGFSSTSTAGR